MSLELSLILPTCGRLESLEKILYVIDGGPLGGRVELVVGSNEPSPEEQELLKSFQTRTGIPLKHLENPQNLGMNRNLFIAVREAVAPFVMFLSDDDFTNTETIIEILEEIKRDPEIGVLRHATWNESESGEFVRADYFPESRKMPGGVEAAATAFLHCGQITGVTLNRSYIDLQRWPLDRKIYPQTRLGGICAFRGGYHFIVSEGGPRIPKNGEISFRVSDEMGRPVDYGVLERVDNARELCSLDPVHCKEMERRMMGSISDWATKRIFPLMYDWDPQHAMRYLQSLMGEAWLTGRKSFWSGLLGQKVLDASARRRITQWYWRSLFHHHFRLK